MQWLKRILPLVFILIGLGFYTLFFSKISEQFSQLIPEPKVEQKKITAPKNTDSSPSENKTLQKAHQDLPKEDMSVVLQIQAAYATGDYGHCLELARKHIQEKNRSPAFKKWLREQMDVILSSYGWLKLKTGRCDHAIELLNEAKKIKSSSIILKGLAYCHYYNHSLDAAEEHLLAFQKSSSEKDSDILRIYSEVLESKGRYQDAVKIVEQLYELDPTPLVERKLKSMKEKANKANLFQTISTRFFILTFEEDKHRELAERILELLEKALDDMIMNFHFREPKKPVEVLLYAEKDFLNFNPDSPLWAEALFNGRIRMPIHEPFNLMSIQTTLRHELVHALFSQITGGRSLPSWFDEGVAQFASNCQKSCTPFVFDLSPGPFLEESMFHHPFATYKEPRVHHAYKQSLYLILAIEHRYKSGLQTIIESIKVDSSLDSNTLLRGLGTNFSDLRSYTEGLWSKRFTFND